MGPGKIQETTNQLSLAKKSDVATSGDPGDIRLVAIFHKAEVRMRRMNEISLPKIIYLDHQSRTLHNLVRDHHKLFEPILVYATVDVNADQWVHIEKVVL